MLIRSRVTERTRGREKWRGKERERLRKRKERRAKGRGKRKKKEGEGERERREGWPAVRSDLLSWMNLGPASMNARESVGAGDGARETERGNEWVTVRLHTRGRAADVNPRRQTQSCLGVVTRNFTPHTNRKDRYRNVCHKVLSRHSGRKKKKRLFHSSPHSSVDSFAAPTSGSSVRSPRQTWSLSGARFSRALS